jgi:serine/threonine-protein kinase
MPAKVTLTVVRGENTGRQHVFEDRTTALVGRDPECTLQFPKDRAHQTISRHHCLIDINPPDVRIRDLGSRTGTYINDRLIGKRDKTLTAEQGRELVQPELELRDGDLIKLGNTVFRVSMFVPTQCRDCSLEIPEGELARSAAADGTYRCSACRAREQPDEPRTVTLSPTRCARCGGDVSGEADSRRGGELLCTACRAHPMQLVLRLLELAESGSKELVSVRGYEIEKELGQGGMGAVYLARHQQTGQRVALKVMLPGVAANKRSRDMFLREATNTRSLQHPHVVQLYDLGFSEGSFFFTLEYCAGGSIGDLLKKRKEPLPVDKAVPLALQALDGLIYAHQAEITARLADGSISHARGLVHRDIKPQNIFLAKVGDKYHAKIGDYGLSKAFDLAGLSGMSMTGTTAGTPVFMPRQQLVDFKHARPEVDVWALAASLYYMLTRKYPRDFPRGTDPWQIVLQTDPVPIRQRAPSIPVRLAEVIDAALIDRPHIGFQSAQELKAALEDTMSS